MSPSGVLPLRLKVLADLVRDGIESYPPEDERQKRGSQNRIKSSLHQGTKDLVTRKCFNGLLRKTFTRATTGTMSRYYSPERRFVRRLGIILNCIF